MTEKRNFAEFLGLLTITILVVTVISAIISVGFDWDYDEVENYVYGGALGLWIGKYQDAREDS